MSSIPGILLGGGLVLVGLLGAWISLRHGPLVFAPPAHRALRRLERGLGLGVRDRILLKRLAHAINERDRTCLLIGRGCFEAAVEAYAPPDATMSRIESLRQRIFGTAVEACVPISSP